MINPLLAHWIYFDLSDAKRCKMDPKYDSINLTLDAYDYDEWYTEESDYSIVKVIKKKIDNLPPLEGDKEVKERKWLKILTLNKLLTRLPVLLAQIKTGNNSNKLKNKMRQKLCLLYQQNKITKTLYNNLIKVLK